MVTVSTLCLASCGLGFVGPGARALPANYQRVSVPVFENRSAEVQLGVDCARLLQDRLSAGGRQVVSGPQGADLVLVGVVEAVRDRPLAFAGSGQGGHLESEVEVEVSLMARSTQGELWRGEHFLGYHVYISSGPPLEVQLARREAVHVAGEEATLTLAEELVDSLWEVNGVIGAQRPRIEDTSSQEGVERPAAEPTTAVGPPSDG